MDHQLEQLLTTKSRSRSFFKQKQAQNQPKITVATQQKSLQKKSRSSRGHSLRSSINSKSINQEHSRIAEAGRSGHFQYLIGEIINGKYKVIKHICDGTFGRVMQVEDITNKMNYALKIIRPVERYIEAAKDESNILGNLPKNDNLLSLIDCFYYKEYYCILTPLYGPSIQEVLQMNDYNGYKIGQIQNILRQLLQALVVVHSLGLTHTDLKPENILFSSNNNNCDKIVLIDFGNGTYSNEYHSRIINTREYRCPEVVLQCCQWNESSDMWGVGCIGCELVNGQCLFGGIEEEEEDELGILEHLLRMEKCCGKRVQEWMIDGASLKVQNLVGKKRLLRSRQAVKINNKWIEDNKDMSKNVREMKTVEEIIGGQNAEFIDLVKKMLTIDPFNRISSKDALQHPFFSIQY